MDSKKVKQAFKESILFREQAIQNFEKRLGKLSFSEASKILESLKVDSLSKLKEQVMEGEMKVEEINQAMPSEQMETEQMTEDAGVADSPAEAEEGSTSDPNPKGAENRESADGEEETETESADEVAEETETESGDDEEPTLKQVMEKLEDVDSRLVKIESLDSEEEADMSEEGEPEAQPEEEINEEGAEEDGDISDDELPEPPAMNESASSDEEEEENKESAENDDETNKESLKKKSDFTMLFKN